MLTRISLAIIGLAATVGLGISEAHAYFYYEPVCVLTYVGWICG